MRILSIPVTMLFVGVMLLTINIKQEVIKEPSNFAEVLTEVKAFWEEETGNKVKTPIRPELNWERYEGVLAYCYQQPGNKFLAFNYALINEYGKGNMDFVFQVILHEYTHCEASIGHVEMYGHYMNNGGAPFLTKEQVKEQFIDYVKYYRTFYDKLFRVEEDATNMYALMIEKDANGNVTIKCPCKQCMGLK